MILYNPSFREEYTLRVEYVNSNWYNHSDYNGYRNYTMSNVSGVVEVGYRGGDDPDTIESLVFDKEENISWFKLRYS